MKVKCDYCGVTYEDTLDKCPNCGGPNPHRKEDAENPTTIAELQQWYAAHKLPPYSVTRFFIGEDCEEPKCFGVYYDANDSDYVVYKNKADGTRVERYRGDDEAYAVNEILAKLKDEILKQKVHSSERQIPSYVQKHPPLPSEEQHASRSSYRSGIDSDFLIELILAVFLIVMLGAFLATTINAFSSIQREPSTGYYNYGNNIYYNDSYGNWYLYHSLLDSDDDDYWEREHEIPDGLRNDYRDYYVSRNWDSSAQGYSLSEDVLESPAYEEATEEYHSDNSYSDNGSNYGDSNNTYTWDDSDSWSSDDDYSWDSGSDYSWDSSGTDWDSNW